MKILQVIYELSTGGAERFVVDLSNELSSLGEEVYLCVFLNESAGDNILFYKHLIHKNVKYINLGTSPGFKISTFFKVHKLLDIINPDIVHLHLNVIPYFFIEALLKPKIKIIHTLHSIAESNVLQIQKPLNKYFYKSNRLIPITISEVCDNSYKQFYTLENSICIHNGRSEVELSEDHDNIRKEIERFKKLPSDLVFVHIASFSKTKNQDLLISSFNVLNEEGVNFVLLIIGSGFDKPAAENLRKRACSKIKFLGIKSNIGDYLIYSDAFCLTSFYEGLPITLLEALSCGCTPICTPAGGITDVIIDGKTGYLAKDLTIYSYVSCLKAFIMKPHDILKQNLMKYFRENYSITICAEKYLANYRQKVNVGH